MSRIGTASDSATLRENISSLRGQLKRKISNEQDRQANEQQRLMRDRYIATVNSVSTCDVGLCLSLSLSLSLSPPLSLSLSLCRLQVPDQLVINSKQLRMYVSRLYQLMETEQGLLQRHPSPHSTAGHQCVLHFDLCIQYI